MTTLLTMKGFNKQVQPVTTAGIYHSPEQGLISLSSDGTNWITIADKNLGATQVYNDGDTLSEANAGKYYQWGNNYGFPFTGGVTTSGGQVNASTYGPGNYYSSSTFIARSDGQWDSSGNMNLWGGTTGTNEAMQGPCSNGYHIPTNNELTGLLNLISGMGISISNFNSLKQYLKMSPAGWRARASGGVTLQGSYIRIWSSIGYSTYMAYYINGYSSGLSVTGAQQAEAMNIRPFKNTPVQPDGSRTVLYPTN